jgi:hypothetical protein
MSDQINNKEPGKGISYHDLYFMISHTLGYEESKPQADISQDTRQIFTDLITKLKDCTDSSSYEYSFSDTSDYFALVPIWEFNSEKEVSLEHQVSPVIRENYQKEKYNNSISRFYSFKVESLPLFDIAKSMGIRVEKQIISKRYGYYSPGQNKIVMGTDDPQVFLHELSHAIDGILPGWNCDLHYGEALAEFSAAFLATIYDIPFDIANVRSYICRHLMYIDSCGLVKRVLSIYQFIENQRKKILNLPTLSFYDRSIEVYYNHE